MRVRWVLCCAVIAMLIGWLPTAVAQDDLFGSPVGPGPEEGIPTANERTPTDAGPVGGEMGLGMGRGMVAMKAPAELCHCVGQDGGPSVAKIKQALGAPLNSSGLEFTDTPLTDVMNQLQNDYGIPVQLDITALDAIGISADEPVNVNLRNISLQSALRLMLRKLGATYVIDNEVLSITTPDEAEKQLVTCVYDVRDLIDGSKEVKAIRPLIETIVSCVHTETWAENGGGEAEIRPLNPGLLVISQTHAIHEEVRGLLNGIRQMRGRPVPGEATTAVPTMGAAPVADQVVTRYYALQTNQPPDKGELRSQIRNLITQSLPDEQWEGRLGEDQAIVLAVLPDRVVLRQTPAVHDKVQALLVESGLALPTAATGMMGMEGGYGGRGGGFFNTGFGAPGFAEQTGEAGGGYGGEGAGYGRSVPASSGASPSE